MNFSIYLDYYLKHKEILHKISTLIFHYLLGTTCSIQIAIWEGRQITSVQTHDWSEPNNAICAQTVTSGQIL